MLSSDERLLIRTTSFVDELRKRLYTKVSLIARHLLIKMCLFSQKLIIINIVVLDTLGHPHGPRRLAGTR